jgi:hypothetical protein
MGDLFPDLWESGPTLLWWRLSPAMAHRGLRDMQGSPQSPLPGGYDRFHTR